jgi:hypothetical protein
MTTYRTRLCQNVQSGFINLEVYESLLIMADLRLFSTIPILILVLDQWHYSS